MPTIDELGQKVKAKFPGQYDDMSDSDVGAKVKAKYPNEYADFTGSGSLAGTMTRPRGSSGPIAQQARKNLAGLQHEQGVAEQQDIEASAKAKFVGDIASTIPVAATLATGGLAAPLAIGVQALASGAAGGWSEAAKLALGAPEAVKSPGQLVRRLGVDSALGGAMQGAAEVGSGLLAMGGKRILMPMVAKAASQVEAGKTVLGQYGVNLMNQIRSLEATAAAAKSAVAPSAETGLMLGGQPVAAARPGVQISIDRELQTLEARMAARKTGQSNAFKERWPGMAEKLTNWDGSLSQLTEIKGDLSQMAYKKAGMNFEEVNALKEFAAGVDQKLTRKFYEIGGGELYSAFKGAHEQLFKFDAGVDLAGKALSRIASRAGYAAAGGVLGGIGGFEGGGISGAVKGAAVGAAAGAVTEQGAPWLLKRLLGDKLVAPMAQKAIAGMMKGDVKGAVDIFTRAASQVGADKIVKSWLQEEEETAAAARDSSVVK